MEVIYLFNIWILLPPEQTLSFIISMKDKRSPIN